MAKTPPGTTDQPAPAVGTNAPSGGLRWKNLLIFGIPLFLVQLVAVYFVLTRFLVPPSDATPQEQPGQESHGQSAESQGGNMYVVKDLIVNPAGTNGTRYLLTTVGFSTSTPQGVTELEKKDIQLRDALNTILNSKALSDLVDVSQRESLRVEISRKVAPLVSTGTLSNVYFSKFIIQ